MTTPLTFTEFEQRAGELLGRRPFGACSSRHMLRCAAILRDAAEQVRYLVQKADTGQIPPDDLAAMTSVMLGRVLMQTAALANEIGQPLEVIAGTGYVAGDPTGI